jgi:hypothetical protein
MEITLYWNVAPSALVEVYRRFRGICCLRNQDEFRCDDRGSIAAATLAYVYQSTRCGVLEERNIKFKYICVKVLIEYSELEK